MNWVAIVLFTLFLKYVDAQDDCEEVDKGFKLVPGQLWNYKTEANQSTGIINFRWSDTLKDFPKDKLGCVQNLVEMFVVFYDGNRTMMEMFKKDKKSYFPKNITKFARDHQNDSMPIKICGNRTFIIFVSINVTISF